MGFSIDHQFDGDGSVVTGERIGPDVVSLRVQGSEERMYVDVTMSDYAALCLANVILTVLTRPSGEGG